MLNYMELNKFIGDRSVSSFIHLAFVELRCISLLSFSMVLDSLFVALYYIAMHFGFVALRCDWIWIVSLWIRLFLVSLRCVALGSDLYYFGFVPFCFWFVALRLFLRFSCSVPIPFGVRFVSDSFCCVALRLVSFWGMLRFAFFPSRRVSFRFVALRFAFFTMHLFFPSLRPVPFRFKLRLVSFQVRFVLGFLRFVSDSFH